MSVIFSAQDNLLGLPDPEDGGSTLVQSTSNYFLVNITEHLRRLESLPAKICEPQTSYFIYSADVSCTEDQTPLLNYYLQRSEICCKNSSDLLIHILHWK